MSRLMGHVVAYLLMAFLILLGISVAALLLGFVIKGVLTVWGSFL